MGEIQDGLARLLAKGEDIPFAPEDFKFEIIPSKTIKGVFLKNQKQILITEMYSDHPEVRTIMEAITQFPGGIDLLLFLHEKQITSQQLWRLYRGVCEHLIGNLHILLLGFKTGMILKEDFLQADESMIKNIIGVVHAEANLQQEADGITGGDNQTPG